jgi:acyl-CoA synthetase (AMP-forming)/AMP-acid ligase II
MNCGRLNIGTFLKQTALNFPNQEAIVDGGKRLTWSEFNGRVNALANALIDLGIKKGDRVAYLSQPGGILSLLRLWDRPFIPHYH